MQYIIDCKSIDGRRELHYKLAKTLNLPEWYGNNLDALYDVLTDISEETEIIFDDFDLLRERLGDYAARLIKVFDDSTSENPNLTIITCESDLNDGGVL